MIWLWRSTHGVNQRPVSKQLLGQRREPWLFGAEVLADRVRAGADPSGLVVDVPLVDHRVELGQRVDDRGRGTKWLCRKYPAWTSNPPFAWAPSVPGLQ